MSENLPDVCFFDADIEGTGWKWTDGILGLVPSRSTLQDAEQVLGTCNAVSELANGLTYDFLDGGVRVTILTDHQDICKLLITDRPGAAHILPPDIVAARERYGKLAATRVDRLEGVVFERPGMRIICDPTLSPERVRSVEIYSV